MTYHGILCHNLSYVCDYCGNPSSLLCYHGNSSYQLELGKYFRLTRVKETDTEEPSFNVCRSQLRNYHFEIILECSLATLGVDFVPSPSTPHSRLIDSPREQIIDAVAVYFLMPTRENIAKICQDCKAQLYDSYYFNFITPISRPLLEDLAKATLEANCVAQISKVRRVVTSRL